MKQLEPFAPFDFVLLLEVLIQRHLWWCVLSGVSDPNIVIIFIFVFFWGGKGW